MRKSILALLITTALAHVAGVHAGELKDSALLSALRHGGCVILMREGAERAQMRAMDEALKQMAIPVGPPRVVDQRGADWLRHAVAQVPPAGSDALIVTQMPNISDAYGRVASALKAGGALIFQPDGHGNARLLDTMQIGDWTQLAAQFKR